MVSGVSFRASSLDSASDLLNKPQAYTRPQAQVSVAAPKKKGKARKAIVRTLIAAAVIAGTLVAGKKAGWFTKLVEKGGAEGAGKFTKFLGNVGKYADQAGEWLVNTGKSVANIFKKKPASTAGAEIAKVA